MSVCDCRTAQVLRHHVETKSEHERLASTCLMIIEDIQESGLSDFSIRHLHEFLDTVYKKTPSQLFDHLLDGADCDICRAIASRL